VTTTQQPLLPDQVSGRNWPRRTFAVLDAASLLWRDPVSWLDPDVVSDRVW